MACERLGGNRISRQQRQTRTKDLRFRRDQPNQAGILRSIRRIVSRVRNHPPCVVSRYAGEELTSSKDAGTLMTCWVRQRQPAQAVAFIFHTQRSAFGCDSGSRPLVWGQQLQVVANSGGNFFGQLS